jgi:diguanylate cyclase (GGDEF)-like protein
MTLLLDRRNRLWVGTRGGLDLLQHDADGTVGFRRFGTSDGLENPFVDGLLEGRDGDIWAATGSGLSRLDADTFSVRVYDQHDGVPSTGFWVGGHAAAGDGTMMFASKQGLLLVDPAVTEWTYQPRLAVTSVRVDGVARPEAVRRGLVLTPAERDFSVEFAALDLSSPEANRYRVRLEGYDVDWIDRSATQRVATYTNLDPGEYVLRVRGTNRSGAWSPDEIALPVVVQPGLVETAWFRLLLLLAIPALLLLAHLWRIRRLRKRELELEQLVRERTADIEDANRRLERSSLTDFLTGLPNRRGFAEAAAVELKRLRRSGEPVCIGICDLDDFKEANDTHGHEAGDFVLRSFGTLLTEQLRDSDVAARWGGEEFVLLLPGTTLSGGQRVAEKVVLRTAAAPWTFRGQDLKVTVTIGVAELSGPSDLDACIARADAALYRGKREGKNRVVVADVETPGGPG